MTTKKGQTVACALHARLTEKGLKRVIKKTVLINRLDFDELSPDDLAKLITIEPLKMSAGGGSSAVKADDRGGSNQPPAP